MSRQTPLSFKTVPNRNKTQKWQTARQYNYDGDDWGGYDPYDDYDGYDDPPPPAAVPHDPAAASMRSPASFDRGDERRHFGGPAGLDILSNGGARGPSPARSAVSNNSGGRPSADSPRLRPSTRPREFTNPDEVPRPLKTRASPSPASAARVSSRQMGVASPSLAPDPAPVPSPASTSAADTMPKDKDLPVIPFIRPSDIYKRMAEEREKARVSADNASRPSLESLQRDVQTNDAEKVHVRQLSAVEEGPNVNEPTKVREPLKSTSGLSPVLPDVSRFSGFGSDFLQTSVGAASEKDNVGPAVTYAPPGTHPATDVLTESRHAAPLPETSRQPGVLSHQPSQGYRSVVHQAFDPQPEPSIPLSGVSHEDSQSTSDFSRTNTVSTGTISPITGYVPFSRLPQPRESTVNSAAATTPGTAFGAGTELDGHRRSSSGDSAASVTAAGVQPGYRRSLDPPGANNSPARSPALEDAGGRRLSGPLSAQTYEFGDVTEPGFSPLETSLDPSGDGAILSSAVYGGSEALPRAGRRRAGTDYSVREADLAGEVNRSQNEPGFSPETAAIDESNRDLFLTTHTSTPAWQSTEGAAPNSTTQIPMREVAKNEQHVDDADRSDSAASRRSSWSDFHGSDDNRSTNRNGLSTGQPDEAGTLHSHTANSLGLPDARPAMEREQSFRPHLPGEWVSFSGSPANEQTLSGPIASPMDRDLIHSASRGSDLSEVDLTPTTQRVPLTRAEDSVSATEPAGTNNVFTQVKNAGEALGAALLTTVGAAHQTRDWGTSQPAQETVQPLSRLRAGDVGDASVQPPPARRTDTGTSNVTDVASAASSVPPTPPAKDGQVAVVGSTSTGTDRQSLPDRFIEPIAPLRTGNKAPYSVTTAVPEASVGGIVAFPPNDNDGDGLGSDITRSLGFSQAERAEEDRERDNDVMNTTAKAAVRGAIEGLPSAVASSPRILDKRFSWEEPESPQYETIRAATAAAAPPTPAVNEPEADRSPDIRPEKPYERPRSLGLHIMNADSSDEDDPGPDIRDEAEPVVSGSSHTGITGGLDLVEAGAESEGGDNLALHLSPSLERRVTGMGATTEQAPSSPISARGSPRLPSHHMDKQGNDEGEAFFISPLPGPLSAHPVASGVGPSSSSKKIPAFREILAIKSTPERIQAYDDTRQSFADVDTGLGDWLTKMLAREPELANLDTNTGRSPGLQGGSGFGIRKSSTAIPGTLDASDTAPRTPAKDLVGSAVDMDRMQQRGKDLMKSAGVLGGKAQVGAKGLWQKGRSRFGTKRESSGGPGATRERGEE